MEAVEKRKRQDDEEFDGKKQKAEEEDGVGSGKSPTVTEDEVEEFFAILRRIRVAANYLKTRDGKLTAGVTAETEDLDGEDGGKEEVSKNSEEEDSVEESNAHLDLNLEPPLSKESSV